MKVNAEPLPLSERIQTIRAALESGSRLGLVTSIDGRQLISLLVDPQTGALRCFESALEGQGYKSLTPVIPQAHWFERTIWDMFGLIPEGHPRLKHTHLNEPYGLSSAPLAKVTQEPVEHRYEFLNVDGEGIYEIPVGPIHAGIIEPGHFRFSCYGEVIVNLEIQLGYVHRGVEKRMTELPWSKTRFAAEAAASDMPVANACANAIAIESLLGIQPSISANLIRRVSLEVERVAMHVADLGGLAGDVGFLAISSSMGRLRGVALRMGEVLSGNRFMRSLICPGGVKKTPSAVAVKEIRTLANQLAQDFTEVVHFYFENQVAADRMNGVGKVAPRLAQDFGLVGVAARASGIDYDCRKFTKSGLMHIPDFSIALEQSGDVFARAQVRVTEVQTSLKAILRLLDEYDYTTSQGCVNKLPENLEPNSMAAALVESHRGELIHYIATDDNGKIKRYSIKDPSVNNWTALAIAARNNLVADFPLCNKSFALSYSGHDV